ncbi:MAG: ABC transporter permease [Bdellovibrionales bacterium]|nr:ABC transporter permease [Bdellovibrionales bacterium]
MMTQQVLSLLIANLKLRYRKTLAGFIWVLLNPAILLIVQAIIFTKVLKLPITTYLPFLFSGFLPWVFISQTVEMGATQYKYFSPSIRAFNISPYLVTLSLTLENLITLLAMAFIYFVVSSFFFSLNLYFIVLWILSIIPLIISVFSITFSVSILFLKFKDIKFITSFVLSILYFLTPIFYSIDLIPENDRIYFKLNPFFHLITPFQQAHANISFSSWFVFYAISMFISVVFLFLSLIIWRFNKRDIYLYL